MDQTSLSRRLLRLFLLFLILTALLGISIVLFEDRNQTRWRILGTSSVISVASVAAMACAAFRERGHLRWLGNVGMSLCFAAAAGIVVAIWDFVHDEMYGRFLGCLSTVAGFMALGQLLWLMPLIQPHRWVQKATTYTIAVLTMLICLQIAANINDDAFARTTIAVAIVVALQVLALPILWQLGRRAGGTTQRRLLLCHEIDDIWTDGDGRHYSVRPLEGDLAGDDVIIAEFEAKLGEIVSGTIQRFEGDTVIVNLGRTTEGILPRAEQVPSENYNVGGRIRALVCEVKKVGPRVTVILSRTHRDLVRALFELEVPEIADGTITIRRIEREPGHRTKLAVDSNDEKVDCVGACVGVRGSRIKSIIDELNGERIDVIRWSNDPSKLIAYALKPAEVGDITLDPTTKKALVIVNENQQSLAIGRNGQNVRLASKLTGWDIEIKTRGQG